MRNFNNERHFNFKYVKFVEASLTNVRRSDETNTFVKFVRQNFLKSSVSNRACLRYNKDLSLPTVRYCTGVLSKSYCYILTIKRVLETAESIDFCSLAIFSTKNVFWKNIQILNNLFKSSFVFLALCLCNNILSL